MKRRQFIGAAGLGLAATAIAKIKDALADVAQTAGQPQKFRVVGAADARTA